MNKKIILIILIVICFVGCSSVDSRGFYLSGEKIGCHKATKTDYDLEGYNQLGWNKEGWNKEGFNKEGYNIEGYDEYGYNQIGYDRSGYDRMGNNEKGFNEAGINKETGTVYDESGYDQRGYDEKGWNKEGISKETGINYDKEGYDKSGYDKEGYNRNGWNKEYANKETKTVYDKTGYNILGYDELGYYRDGYDRAGYDKEGYDKKGFTSNGYDKEGYDKNGYDKEGYKKNGYNELGWNKEGINEFTGKIYDKEGYDKSGYDQRGYNEKGWNKAGINKETGKKYDELGFDESGNVNFNIYKTKKTDDFSKLNQEIENIINIKKIEKNEFETTDEFNNRLKKAIEKYDSEKNKLSKKIFVYNFDGYNKFAPKYNADEKKWEISFRNIKVYYNKIDLGTYEASNSFGKTVMVKQVMTFSNNLIFENIAEYGHSDKVISAQILMELEKAKIFKGFKAQLLYKTINNLEESLYNDKYHGKPKIDDPYDRTRDAKGIFVEFIGLIVWDSEMKEVLYFGKGK